MHKQIKVNKDVSFCQNGAHSHQYISCMSICWLYGLFLWCNTVHRANKPAGCCACDVFIPLKFPLSRPRSDRCTHCMFCCRISFINYRNKSQCLETKPVGNDAVAASDCSVQTSSRGVGDWSVFVLYAGTPDWGISLPQIDAAFKTTHYPLCLEWARLILQSRGLNPS